MLYFSVIVDGSNSAIGYGFVPHLEGPSSVQIIAAGSSTYALVASATVGSVQLIDVSDPMLPVGLDSGASGDNGYAELVRAQPVVA